MHYEKNSIEQRCQKFDRFGIVGVDIVIPVIVLYLYEQERLS